MHSDMIRDGLTRWMPAGLKQLGRVVLVEQARDNALHEWRRRRAGEPVLPVGLKRVLVICYGNICRSPFAAELLAARVSGLDVRSAGLEAREGKPAEAAAERVARSFGVDLERHAAHRLETADLEWADLVLGMEGHHLANLRRRWPAARGAHHILGDFLLGSPHTIDDPYGQSDASFVHAFERIEQAVDRLARRIAGGSEPEASA
jgi:protein-tyrosine phosphatase